MIKDKKRLRENQTSSWTSLDVVHQEPRTYKVFLAASLVRNILCISAGHALYDVTAGPEQELWNLACKKIAYLFGNKRIVLVLLILSFSFSRLCSWSAWVWIDELHHAWDEFRSCSRTLCGMKYWMLDAECWMWKVLVASRSPLLLSCVSLVTIEYIFLKAYLPGVAIDMRLLVNSAHPCHEHGRSIHLSLGIFHSEPCSYEQHWVLWQDLEASQPWS